MILIMTADLIVNRFERYKNNTSAERGAVKSPVSSDDAFSPDEVMAIVMVVMFMLRSFSPLSLVSRS